MIDSFVTQCPHCQTRFRLTRAQLRAARGEVRCGACLKVFNAGQQLLSESLEPLSESLDPLSQPLDPARPAAPLNTPAAPLPHEPIPLVSMPPRSAAPRTDNIQAPRKSPDPDDERWAEELIEAEERGNQPAPAPSGYAAPALNPALSAGGKIEPRLGNAGPSEPPAAKPPRRANAQLVRPVESFARSDDPLDLDDPDERLPAWQPPKSLWGRRLGWGLLSLLVALGLLGQYSWYHFDELARQNQYRPWLEDICPLLGCSLPAKVDIRLIKSSNLVVRSHPQFGGALRIDAILYNRASFSQPFPLLEIRFTDRNGQLITSRRFTPGEYLAGELEGQRQMPPQTPIHIALETLDPGPQVVNYSLAFHSPQ
jgi:predicted Zn finger-like uncharacterized protein